MLKEEQLNEILQKTTDKYTGLLQVLSPDDLLELAKMKATEALEGIKSALSRLSRSLRGVIL